MRYVLSAAFALAIVFLALASAHAGSDGHGTNLPDLGTVKDATLPDILRVDPAVLATGERVKDLSLMRNAIPG